MTTVMEDIKLADLRPRNARVLLKRVGKVGQDKIGNILMPSGMNKFDVAEIVAVGPGTFLMGTRGDTSDLEVGQLVWILAAVDIPTGPGSRQRQNRTNEFRIDGEKLELVDESDIYMIIKETDDATGN